MAEAAEEARVADGADVAQVAETIEVSGRRIGGHAWIETRLFEVLGRWSQLVPEPRARALLARQSRHHAWHAELWHDLLPALPHLSGADLVAPNDTTEAAAAALAALDELEPPGEGERLVEGPAPHDAAPDADDDPAAALAVLTVVHREVLPRVRAAYDEHLDHTTPVTDGPTIRVLRLVLADLAEDAAAGDELIAALTPPQG